jgi:type III secretory pathway component EscT
VSLEALLSGMLRVLPSVFLLPLSGLGVLSWPLRVAVAMALTAGVLATPEVRWASPWWCHCARELLVGSTLALLLVLPWMALEQGAAIVASQGQVFDPVAAVTRWLGIVAFVAAGGHYGALRVLAASWHIVPAGSFSGTSARWLHALLDATGEALAGSLLMASSGLLALVVAEFSAALARRVAWPVSREDTDTMRVLSTLAATALGARAIAELVLGFGRRTHELTVRIG